MGSAKMTCRVCGKEYEPCRTAQRNTNVFHWQEVACSPECGSVYLQLINESRGNVETTKKARGKKTPKYVPEPVSESHPEDTIDTEVDNVDTPVDTVNVPDMFGEIE